MGLLDRYVLRNFLEPLGMSMGGFIGVWFIFDISDNGPEFFRSGVGLRTVADFYLEQSPQIILMALPVAILLSLLFGLARMSRANEVIAMLGAGRSLPRILLPLVACGLVGSGVCLWLNSELAPKAEAERKLRLSDMTSREVGRSRFVHAHLFRDPVTSRTWYVKRFTPGESLLEGVTILQQDAEGRVVRKWYAARALYDEVRASWILQRGIAVTLDERGQIAEGGFDDFERDGQRVMEGWTETPWRVGSSRLEPLAMSVSDLFEYLGKNGDFSDERLAPFRVNLWDRLAMPFSCVVIVMLAGPLGIVYSRRGVVAGVSWALMLFFVMFFTRNTLLALGRSGRVDAGMAAWMPLGLFFVVGCGLMWWRSNNASVRSLLRLAPVKPTPRAGATL
ncbi:MAG: Lipopolysaccharide export system permease protein LptG [Verrucomicrobiota bacterium]|jgi:lipopolysaccharide export system permease protein